MKKVGLVGCGSWGKNILRDLIALDCEVCVADIDESAAARASDMGASTVFLSCKALPICDGYVVAVPIPSLTAICAELLTHKKPVFSEKTLCLSMDDYQLLKDLGGRDYVFAMHKWRYHPGIDALRQIAQSGRIGRVAQLVTTRHAWVPDFHGGDVFWTQAVHDLTIIKHILGYIPKTVRAISVVSDDAGLDVGFTAMMGDAPTAVVSVSGRHTSKKSGVSIHGSKGSSELYNAYDDHILIRNDDGENKMPVDTTFPLYLELKEFIGYLNGGPRPRCDLDEAREVAEAILNLKRFASK